MTRHRKAAKADKKSRNKKATSRNKTAARPETVRPGTSDQPRDAPSDLHEDGEAPATGDADQLLRRPPRRRAAPIGPPLGDHVEATSD
jgi:hypothetical protein